MWLCIVLLINIVTSWCCVQGAENGVLRDKSTASCLLPPYPEHGTYEVANLINAHPGQSYDAVVLTVKCREGYGVVDPHGSSSDTQQVYCLNGQWAQTMPECVRFCKLNQDPSVNYMCQTQGRGVESCKSYVSPATIVRPVCNSPFYYSNEVLPQMRCISGKWDYIALCKAECGRIAPEENLLLADAEAAKGGELPWSAAIYRKTPKLMMQICGGSLVSHNVIISAAHCFWSTNKLLPASEFAVAVGKLHRSWDSVEDVKAQKSDVKQIKIPSLYQGYSANFQEDIAVLILSTPFTYTKFIRPVCLDFDGNFERLQLQPGRLGKVASWGLKATDREPSQTLKILDVPFISLDICLETLPISFREYITSDKFCAGHNNGTAACRGDGGAGLAFPTKELGTERYYLRGVISVAPHEEDQSCSNFIALTKISKHQDFIEESMNISSS